MIYDNKFIMVSKYEEKDTIKAAGFRWNPETKYWWTDDLSKAITFLSVADESAQKALEDFSTKLKASRATSTQDEIPIPKGLQYLPYQRAGISFAKNNSSCLIGDEMGLGKTIQAIGAINADPSITTVLVVCPASLKINWMREMKKWLVRDMEITIISGKDNGFVEGINIINYDILTRYTKELTSKIWDMLIVDEAHKIKNYKAQRSQAIYGKEGIKAHKKIFLTGTPIVNRPKDLWSILNYLDPINYSDFWSYHKRYCNAHKELIRVRGGMREVWNFDGASNLEELQTKLRGTLLIRRLKKDVLADLPPKIRQTIVISVEDPHGYFQKERGIYDTLRNLKDKAEQTRGTQDYREAIEALNSFRQVSFTEIARLRHNIAITKIPYVCEHILDLIEEDPDKKLVVFAHHHDMINALSEKLGNKAVSVTGKDSMVNRQTAVDAFQNNPQIQVFLGSIEAAGVGLTLTASSHVVFAEWGSYVPSDMVQAEDRCHRIGQKDSVLYIVAEGSIDEHIANTIIKKQDIIDTALDIEPVIITEESTTKKSTTKNLTIIDQETIEVLHQAMRILTGLCDGAKSQDGMGFNKFDTYIGKSIAGANSLTQKQAHIALRLAIKYQRQLPTDMIEKIK